MPLRIPRGLSFKIYVIITLTISILTLFCGYSFINTHRALLIEQKHKYLLELATSVERQFAKFEMVEHIESVNSLPISDKEKLLMLNKIYQPLVEKVSAENPNIGLGIYTKELGVIAIAPNFDPIHLMKDEFNPIDLKSYETGRTEFINSETSIDWDGKPVVAVTYPVMYKGTVMIGHTWADAKTEDIDAAVTNLVIKLLFYGFIFWAIAVCIVYLCFKKLNTTLVLMAKHITEQNDDRTTIRQFPELVTIFETVISLREKLKCECETRIQLHDELSKIDRFNIVGELAASVTHEIRNPMTTIQGYLQLQKKKYPDTHAYLDIALEELNNVNSIIEDYLALARNRSIEKIECSLNEIIQKLQPLLYADCVKSVLSLEMELDPAFPQLLLNPKEIKQMILNIARNGIDAMSPKGTLTIRTAYQENAGKLFISDTGCGISQENIGGIFDLFYTTKKNGTGIGLSVCASIIEKHAGKIEVRSALNIGTTFIVSFPLK